VFCYFGSSSFLNWSCASARHQSCRVAFQGFGMVPQHVDVNVPTILRPELGKLLAQFETYVTKKGYICRRKPKLDGGQHVTPWWLMVILESGAPAKSQCQFGETDFADVNPVPHLWSRGKEAYRQKAYDLLTEFVVSREKSIRDAALHDTMRGEPERQEGVRPPPPRPAPAKRVLWDFDGGLYGREYLTLRVGDAIISRQPPELVEKQGWEYGLLLGTRSCCGWYPPTFAP